MRKAGGIVAAPCYGITSERAATFRCDLGFRISLHLVLRNRPVVAEQWSDDEIALRWRRVFPPRDDTTGEPVEPTERDLAMLMANPERLLELRKRLSNLSWFMRCLCEKTGRNRCAASVGC